MYTRAQAADFWYEFDQRFLFASPLEVIAASAVAPLEMLAAIEATGPERVLVHT